MNIEAERLKQFFLLAEQDVYERYRGNLVVRSAALDGYFAKTVTIEDEGGHQTFLSF